MNAEQYGLLDRVLDEHIRWLRDRVREREARPNLTTGSWRWAVDENMGLGLVADQADDDADHRMAAELNAHRQAGLELALETRKQLALERGVREVEVTCPCGARSFHCHCDACPQARRHMPVPAEKS